MPAVNFSSHERRKAELAGGVILKTLALMPPTATISDLLLEILDAGIHDPDDRALFGFPPRRAPGGQVPPRGGGTPPALAGGVAAFAEKPRRRASGRG